MRNDDTTVLVTAYLTGWVTCLVLVGLLLVTR